MVDLKRESDRQKAMKGHGGNCPVRLKIHPGKNAEEGTYDGSSFQAEHKFRVVIDECSYCDVTQESGTIKNDEHSM
jgi:hypothetical protein